MERYDWKITINTTIKRMKVAGLWPAGDESYKLNLYGIWSAFVIIVFTFGHVFWQTFNIMFTFNDLEAVTGMLYVTLSEILIVIKAYFAVKNMKILKQLMVTLNGDMFQPRNQRQLEMIKPDLKFWKINSYMFWGSVSMAVFFWSTFPIFDNSIKDHRLPFLAWYPYRTDLSPNYEITYIYQVFGVAFSACTAITVDTLIAALHMYIGTQFDILCDDIRHLHDPTNGESTDYIKKFLKCIEHHRAILKFYEHTSNFSNWIVFGQFMISTLALAITMFQLTTVPAFSSEFFALFAYLAAVAVQIFLYCWFGNEVEVKSRQIPYAIFESDWTGASVELKKLMVIFVERNQKPLKVMALDLFFLNLDTFMKEMKRFDWKLTIKSTVLRMKIAGLWPEDDESYKLNLYTLWSIFSLTFFTLGHCFFQTINVIFIFDNLEALVATIYINLTELLNAFKGCFIIKNMKILKQLMVNLNSDLFQPRNYKQIQAVEFPTLFSNPSGQMYQ
ncbi:7tm 6 domain containing protein [Asbolus verrucosus]|uniref:7tm 6 domain containing protein n=1 Tax=Asbolus verrucosus TaxID=1661398 RepID=A0A482WAN8_ASBVE|nr:7tm 6 domain containing protein [Asbolus verrucosus]